jgi:hypothetical protein
MNKNLFTMIATVASSAFQASIKPQPPGLEAMMYSDPVLAGAFIVSNRFSRDIPNLNDLVETILADEEFGLISPREGELDPMIFHHSGGFRMPGREIIYSLFSNAFRHMFFFGLPNEESVFIRTVLEGFEELRKAVRGEPVRGYEIKGLAQVTVPPNSQLNTPWGIIRPTPAVDGGIVFPRIGQPNTRALLIETKLVPLVFDRSQSPEAKFQPPTEHDQRSWYLLPLACALASKDHLNPVVPVITWSTFLIPFQGFFGYSSPILGPIIAKEQDASQQLEDLEGWALTIERAHSPEVDVAAKRLVSAAAHRTDKADALIDAVMVWENLLGTSNEVTFRVSASLAKLIESDPEKRIKLKRSLSDIYGIRSRIIHGTHVDAPTVQGACSEAIGTAVLALRQSYRRGREWLSMNSAARSEEILLSWQ